MSLGLDDVRDVSFLFPAVHSGFLGSRNGDPLVTWIISLHLMTSGIVREYYWNESDRFYKQDTVKSYYSRVNCSFTSIPQISVSRFTRTVSYMSPFACFDNTVVARILCRTNLQVRIRIYPITVSSLNKPPSDSFTTTVALSDSLTRSLP